MIVRSVVPVIGLTVMPGLWDVHAHTYAARSSFALLMAHGVTSIGRHEGRVPLWTTASTRPARSSRV